MADYQSVAPTTTAITLDDAKRHLNVTTDLDDDLILGQIKAATQMLENRSRRAFVTQTRILKMRTFGDSRYVLERLIRPPISPLRSVTSVVYIASNGTTTTMPSSDYLVSIGDKPGTIGEAYNATWPNTRNVQNDVTITYVAGHSTVNTGVPEYAKQAVRMLVGHWYRNRESVLTGTISKEIEYGIDALMEAEHVESYG